ncbi:MAG: hypothetical protein JWO97_1835 [Acidobacteria bacterium]|nr:hypothetical protein [Acidobacteriota bacterium]
MSDCFVGGSPNRAGKKDVLRACYDPRMRVIAAALLLALLFPAMATAVLGAGVACCCVSKAGASCPMKRSAAACSTAASSCSIGRADSASIPNFGIQRPATLTPFIIAAVDLTTEVHAPARFIFPARFLDAPDSPPPERG